MTDAVKLLKVFSLSGVALSVAGIPIVGSGAVMSGNASVDVSVMTAAAAFSAGSTWLVHKYLAPYVTSIYMENADKSSDDNKVGPTGRPAPNDDSLLTFETLTLFNRPISTTVRLGDIDFSSKFSVTWRIRPQEDMSTEEQKAWLAQFPRKDFTVILNKRTVTPELRDMLNSLQSKEAPMRITDMFRTPAPFEKKEQ
ncbi:hypothetical protein RI367_007759 [Sorochytrium milnesiophthora]